MNKRELIDYVCQNLETTKAGAEETVNVVLRAIQEGIANDDSVSVAGFGTWNKRFRSARTGRNPQTGEPIQIKASTTVGFKPAKAWKEDLNAPAAATTTEDSGTIEDSNPTETQEASAPETTTTEGSSPEGEGGEGKDSSNYWG
jgi:DNA-binding protein HU-alpha